VAQLERREPGKLVGESPREFKMKGYILAQRQGFTATKELRLYPFKTCMKISPSALPDKKSSQ